MKLRNSLNQVHQKIKEFHDIVKKEVFYLSKCNLSVIKSKNDSDLMPLSMALFYLRNLTREMSESNVKFKEYTTLQANLKRLFQEFVDTPELINFDKGSDLFVTLNEDESISVFQPLFHKLFKEVINQETLKKKCLELKENLINLSSFEEKFKEIHCSFKDLEKLRVKLETFQNLIKKEDLKTLNTSQIKDFRVFKALKPSTPFPEYVIDIETQKIVKLNQ